MVVTETMIDNNYKMIICISRKQKESHQNIAGAIGSTAVAVATVIVPALMMRVVGVG